MDLSNNNVTEEFPQYDGNRVVPADIAPYKREEGRDKPIHEKAIIRKEDIQEVYDLVFEDNTEFNASSSRERLDEQVMPYATFDVC